MKEYFESEMRLLNEAARDFASQYPEQAGMLNLGDVSERDPYVERLLEGMAFLTAQIRKKIDDDIPEISESLLQQLWPVMLRPMPSATIMEFAPMPGQIQATKVLGSGVEVVSGYVGDESKGINECDKEIVSCRFRTVVPIKLHPLRLNDIEIDEPLAGGTVLRLRFQADTAVTLDKLDLSPLSVYLNADMALALELYHMLTNKSYEINVRFPYDPTTPAVNLGTGACVPLHLSTHDNLAPGVDGTFQGYQLLQEYFSFKEKYLFVGFCGFEKVVWPKSSHEFELEVKFEGKLPPEHRLSVDNFKLYCAPAINLFEHDAEPVRVSQRKVEYPLIADSANRNAVQVYSVDSVSGIENESGKRLVYNPVRRFSSDDDDARYYKYSLRSSGSERLDAYVSIGGGKPRGVETLSCELTCNNGHFPRKYLTEGSLAVAGKDCPSFVRPRNLIRPSQYLPPVTEQNMRWSLVASLAANYDSISSPRTLRKTLAIYDWSRSRQNNLRIEGITDVKISPVEWLRRGALVRGLEITITVKEGNYRSPSDIYLFGTVLHQFFATYAQINTVMKTKIILQPSNRELSWEPRQGEKLPI